MASLDLCTGSTSSQGFNTVANRSLGTPQRQLSGSLLVSEELNDTAVSLSRHVLSTTLVVS
jgi:hypothetical protein